MVGEPYGVTVWRGSALSSCSVHEITLLHRDFGVNTAAAFRNCYSSNSFIVAQGFKVENGSYISQLNVTVTSDVIGKSVECLYDNQIGTTTTVGSLNLTLSGKIVTAATEQRLLL